MKHVVTILLMGFVLVGGLAACGKKGDPKYKKTSEQLR